MAAAATLTTKAAAAAAGAAAAAAADDAARPRDIPGSLDFRVTVAPLGHSGRSRRPSANQGSSFSSCSHRLAVPLSAALTRLLVRVLGPVPASESASSQRRGRRAWALAGIGKAAEGGSGTGFSQLSTRKIAGGNGHQARVSPARP